MTDFGTLRALRAPAPSEAAEDIDAPRGVLVVEDDALVRDTLGLQLSAAGWAAASVADLAGARDALIADSAIGVVLCDVNLGAECGLALAEDLATLRDEARAIEIIFITGDATCDTAITALRNRAFDLVQKPYSRHELIDRVAAAAASAARRRRQAVLLDRLQSRVEESELQKRRLAAALRDAENQNRALSDSTVEARHQLLMVIAHELRTPLIPIVGLASIMAANAELSAEEIREYATLISEGGERLGAIVDRTLEYLDAERDYARAEKRSFTAGELIEAALGELPQRLSADAPVIAVEGPADLRAWGAPRLLAQALAELIDNAIKASSSIDDLSIRARPLEQGRIAIDVQDTGPGLPDSVRRDLGVPFLHGDVELTRSWSGVGIGLARAQRIARLNGGDLIACDSDEGAHLRLILPVLRP